MANNGSDYYYYHYTDQNGVTVITNQGVIHEFTLNKNRRDASIGEGAYFTTIPPSAGKAAIAANNYDMLNDSCKSSEQTSQKVALELQELKKKFRDQRKATERAEGDAKRYYESLVSVKGNISDALDTVKVVTEKQAQSPAAATAATSAAASTANAAPAAAAVAESPVKGGTETKRAMTKADYVVKVRFQPDMEPGTGAPTRVETHTATLAVWTPWIKTWSSFTRWKRLLKGARGRRGTKY